MYKEFHDVYKQSANDDIADRIFRFIYEIADLRSYSNKRNFKDEAKYEYAKTLAKLPHEFIITPTIDKAIKKYSKESYSVNAQLLKDLTATLHLSIKINEHIKTHLETTLSNDKVEKDEIGTIFNMQKQLFEMIDKLPSMFNKVKELEAKVHDELSKPKPIGRGTGEEIPDSYEGDPDIEGEL
jgi:DNA integrity scanning protein DisA with diadenylate cyclase activity